MGTIASLYDDYLKWPLLGLLLDAISKVESRKDNRLAELLHDKTTDYETRPGSLCSERVNYDRHKDG